MLGDIMSETTGCPTADTIEAASTWLIVLRDDYATTADKAAFADWLLQSPTHIHEFLLCDQVWSLLQEIDWRNVTAAAEVTRAAGTSATPASNLH